MDYIDEYHQDKFYATILETENIRAVDHQFQFLLKGLGVDLLFLFVD